MKKVLKLLALLACVIALSGCGGEYMAKANYDAQEAEGQAVMPGELNEAYYAAKKILKDEGLSIVSDSRGSQPVILTGEAYQMRSEGERITNSFISNMLGGDKAADKVVSKEVKRRTIIIKPRYDINWNLVKGKIGVIYKGETEGVNGQGEVVENIEKSVPADEAGRIMDKLGDLTMEYVKDNSKMNR
ncbi:MAG: hypothetical protein ABSA34_01730 [Candidatus Goldiibacteriota bacterium]